LLLNNPHNPIGKVFSVEELQAISIVAKKHNLTVVSDEVYEKLVFDDARHVRIASLPDMFDRTITISSAGKTFSVTGWKVGWTFANESIVEGLTANIFGRREKKRPLYAKAPREARQIYRPEQGESRISDGAASSKVDSPKPEVKGKWFTKYSSPQVRCRARWGC
jgi:aspartate/tyrosine/aromatic aminotransferase